MGRNPSQKLSFLKVFYALSHEWCWLSGPGITTNSTAQVIFHPLTGLCVSTTLPSSRALQLLPCQKASRWTWKFGAGNIQLLGPTTPCINFIQDASSTTRVQLTESCGERGTKWQKASAAQMQISTQVGNYTLCLETSGNEVTVADCLCLSGCASAFQDPSNQLFEFILAPLWWSLLKNYKNNCTLVLPELSFTKHSVWMQRNFVIHRKVTSCCLYEVELRRMQLDQVRSWYFQTWMYP